jgi:hypothetical protein
MVRTIVRQGSSAGLSGRRLGRAIVLFASLSFAPVASLRAEFVPANFAMGPLLRLPTWGAQAVDIDGDFDVDLLRNLHFYATTVHTNDGSGRLSLEGIPQFVTTVGDRHGFVWADLDNDGYLDVACSHGGSGGCGGCDDEGNELWRAVGPGIFEVVPNAGGMFDANGRGRTFSAADVDGDGDLDLHHGKAPLAQSANSLHRNDGSFQFVDIAADLGLDEHFGTVGALFADYDDDGDPDLFLGGEEFLRPTLLYRNDGSSFADATVEAFGGPLPIISGADWGDFDNDQDLDLAVCEGVDGIYDAFGMDGDRFWFFAHHRFGDDGVDIFRFDTVGGEDPEIEVQASGLFDNDLVFLGPNGVHPTVTEGEGSEGQIEGSSGFIPLDDSYVGLPSFQAGVDHGVYIWRWTPGGTWFVAAVAPPTTFGNFSGIARAPSGIVNPQAFNLEEVSLSPLATRVYKNEGGIFTEVTSSLGLTPRVNPRAVEWVDFDNDGDLDLHQMNKGITWTGNERDILWQNDGDFFTALKGPGWVPGLPDHLTDGGVWADFDGDGDLDLFLQEGAPPAFWAYAAPGLHYRNRGPAGHWLSVTIGHDLWAATPVGTRVTAQVGERFIHRRVEANAWRGFQSPMALHFGIGEATVIDRLVIEGPLGQTLDIGPLDADQAILVGAGGELRRPMGPSRLPSEVFVRVFPQPAREEQAIRLTSPSSERLLVSVYDIRGRLVRSLHDGVHEGGELRLTWDGRDANGLPVASGVYFLRGHGGIGFESKIVRLR